MTHYPNAAVHAMPARGAATASAQPAANSNAAPMRQLYLALSNGAPAGHEVQAAADWLAAQLTQAQLAAARNTRAAALPSDGAPFAAWHAARQADIDEAYKQYVAERRAGAPRRLFSGRAHALHYLTAVAPDRLTDGAWLYGVLSRWDDPALRPLITTYLEELGNGVPDKNHVVIFQQLIDAHGCANWQQLGEAHFHNGLTRLALAHHAERFFPEMIGYNLGSEFASIETLIAAYELNELGIDPYYFTLHVSVDNSATGHAVLALEALHQLTPQGDDAAEFLHRVDAGFHLHASAPTSAALLAGFNLQRELHAAFDVKHVPATGADGEAHPAHSLTVGGRSLGEWLAHPGQAPALLDALLDEGWFERGGDPAASRLWSLIEAKEHADTADDAAPTAPLAGLFSSYELALLADWIATDPQGAGSPAAAASAARRAGAFYHSGQPAPRRIEESAERGIIRHRFPDDEHGWEAIANELTLLEARVVASSSKQEAIDLLAALMAPSRHHTSTGMMATRMFSKLFTA
jgi:hypothetical protein